MRLGKILAGSLTAIVVSAPAGALATDFRFSGQIVTWTAPTTGIYAITAWGARGGSGADYYLPGGSGAEIGGYATLNAGTVLSILVGGAGGSTILDFGGGGGGGSFVAVGDQPLVVAGGGGGAGYAWILPGRPGLAGSSGGDGEGSLIGNSSLGGAGGTLGNGGQDGSRDGAGFGGGGFYTGSQPGDPPYTYDLGDTSGHSFLSGGRGGGLIGGYGGFGGGGLPDEEDNGSFGGFGGGGAAVFGGGGGGGYSGGGGGGYRNGGGVGGGFGGGGGGSYLAPVLRSYVALSGQGSYDRDGNGVVRINSVVPEPSAWLLMILGFAVAGGAVRRRKATI